MGRLPTTEEGLRVLIVAPSKDATLWRGPYLDGSISKDQIILKVIENHVNNGEVTLSKDNKKIEDKIEIKKELELFMEQTLERLLQNCLFVL